MNTDRSIAAQNAGASAARIVAALVDAGHIEPVKVLEEFDTIRRHIYKGTLAAGETGPQDAPSNRSGGAGGGAKRQLAQDAWEHLLANPGMWWDNRANKARGVDDKGRPVNPKTPDFKARDLKDHPYKSAGKGKDGSPAPLALWVGDAPDNILTALRVRDEGVEYEVQEPDPPAERRSTLREPADDDPRAHLQDSDAPDDDLAPF